MSEELRRGLGGASQEGHGLALVVRRVLPSAQLADQLARRIAQQSFSGPAAAWDSTPEEIE